MDLTVVRKIFTSESTIGELLLNGSHECVTLEDPVRDEKIPGGTAIPTGIYDIILAHSPKFGRKMPRIQNVPNFTGVLIHWRNTAADTEGCILVGSSSAKNFIASSRIAFNALYKTLEDAVRNGEKLRITVK